MNKIIEMARAAGGSQLADYDCAFALNLGSLQRFRDAVLEEAALACDDYDCGTPDDLDRAARMLGKRIRALKEQK